MSTKIKSEETRRASDLSPCVPSAGSTAKDRNEVRSEGSVPATLMPRDTHVLQPKKIKRLTRQCYAMLARLQQGPATARQLIDEVCISYRQRISDLRDHGYVIRCDEDQTSGMSWYRLEL